MPVMKPYTSQADLATFLGGITITSTDADLAINAATQLVEQITNRVFIADTEATPRYFDGSGSSIQIIDDCIEIETVEAGLDEYGTSYETIPSTGISRYMTLPANANSRGVPFTSIQLRNEYWIRGVQNQKITARWGFSESAPQLIVQATTIIAAGMYMYNRGGASGQVTSEKIGNYAVSYGSDSEWRAYANAKKILQGYMRRYL
jgi:hypothetical protein